MTPYYEHQGISVYHDDCREVLSEEPRASSIGLVLADPPWGISYQARRVGNRKYPQIDRFIKEFVMKKCLALISVLLVGSFALSMAESASVPNDEGHRMIDIDFGFGLLSQVCNAAPGGCLEYEMCRMRCANLPWDAACLQLDPNSVCWNMPPDGSPGTVGPCLVDRCKEDCFEECEWIPHGQC